MIRYFAALVVLSGLSFAQDDPETKGLAWHRYVTPNFTILSLEDDQGLWMKNNMEDIKQWCLDRWGIQDARLSKECRVFCVPDRGMLKKLFDLDGPRVEVRRKDGSIQISAMWLSMDEKPARAIPSSLTKVLLAEYEESSKTRLPWWSVCGMSVLNGSVQDIRSDLSELPQSKMLSSESLMDMTQEQYEKMGSDQRRVFDVQSAAMLLLVRKEFGEVKMHSLLSFSSRKGSSQAIRSVLGFSGHQDFNKTFNRYVGGLGRDIKSKATPDSYLTIRKAGA